MSNITSSEKNSKLLLLSTFPKYFILFYSNDFFF